MSVNRNPQILLISPSVICQDPRVLSHLEVLQEFGDVTTLGYGTTPHESISHIRINDTVSYLPKSFMGLLRILLGLNVSAAAGTSFSKAALVNTYSKTFDLVVANDVHTLAVAHAIAKRNNAKFWADMHEYAPLEGEHDWRWMLAFRRYVKRLCLKYLKTADCVTTVGEGIRRKFEEDLGREVLVLRNTASYSPRIRTHDQKEGNQLSLIHVGVAIRARCLENMIQAVKELDGVTLDLLILPTDKKYFDELCQMTQDLFNIQILPSIETSEINSFISKYHCGIVTIPPTSFNYANALPNKIFQYVQARLAVITGPIPEVASIVREYDLGWVTQDFSIHQIRNAVLLAKEQGVVSFVDNLDRAALVLSKENESLVRRRIVENLLESTSFLKSQVTE